MLRDLFCRGWRGETERRVVFREMLTIVIWNMIFTLIVTIVPIIAILWLLKVVEILKFEEIEPFKPVARMFLFRGFLPLIGLTTIFDLVKYYIEKRDQRKLLSEANKIIKE